MDCVPDSGGQNKGVPLELADSQDSPEEEIPGEGDKGRDIRCDRLDARADTASADQSRDGACNEAPLQMLELLLDGRDRDFGDAPRNSSAPSAQMTAPARAPEAGARCSSDWLEARATRPVSAALPGAPSANASSDLTLAASSSATAQAAGASSLSANHSAELLEESLALQQDLTKRLVKDAALLVAVVVAAGALVLQVDPEIRDVSDETASARDATRRDCNSLASACSCAAS